MTTSLRWGFGILASLALQIGCCSVHLNYEGPHCGSASVCPKPVCMDQECIEAPCAHGQGCKINGLGQISESFALLHHRAACGLQCNSGCGEIYWDEHINEPPVCDPCGCNNEWVGGCGSCEPWYSRLKRLWGHPYVSSHCSDCMSCGGSNVYPSAPHSFTHSHVVHDMHEETASSSAMPIEIGPALKSDAVPTPAKPKKDATLLPLDSGLDTTSPTPSRTDSNNASGSSSLPPKKMTDHYASRQSMESGKRIVSKPASSRTKLTTKRR